MKSAFLRNAEDDKLYWMHF